MVADMAPGRTVVAWKAWFTNNPEKPGWRTYESESTLFGELPDDGMEGLVLFLDNGTRQMVSGQTSYFQWSGPDGVVIDADFELPDKVAIRYPGAVIVRGRSVTLEVMGEIDAEMMASRNTPTA